MKIQHNPFGWYCVAVKLCIQMMTFPSFHVSILSAFLRPVWPEKLVGWRAPLRGAEREYKKRTRRNRFAYTYTNTYIFGVDDAETEKPVPCTGYDFRRFACVTKQSFFFLCVLCCFTRLLETLFH